MEEELGQEQPPPAAGPEPAAEDDIEDTAEKDDVQVTTIPLPGEATPAAADVAPPESDFPELESPGSELADYEEETGYESFTQGQSSSDNDKRLSTIPEESSESEGSHDDFLPVDNPDQPVEPREEDHTDVQSTGLHGEPPQMVPEGPTAPETSTDFSPAQLHPESFPPLYVNADRNTVSGK